MTVAMFLVAYDQGMELIVILIENIFNENIIK